MCRLPRRKVEIEQCFGSRRDTPHRLEGERYCEQLVLVYGSGSLSQYSQCS